MPTYLVFITSSVWSCFVNQVGAAEKSKCPKKAVSLISMAEDPFFFLRIRILLKLKKAGPDPVSEKC